MKRKRQEPDGGSAPLAGGFVVGERVKSPVGHEPSNLAKGDTGVVEGPCGNDKVSDASARVCVDFAAGKGKVNILANSQIELIPLAGGYRRGDSVKSLRERESCLLVHLCETPTIRYQA